ncbi:hypothetical protein MLD38_021625 [Melastoma candidum]|uniref:Uncharacterized protein n=1 Tax=Melastoma candidum TaxID=119954 RepID=A0ACB9QK25_9MYRT|nr:hypothetical protein MLD38_021625 [Melastoma candidum]
MVASESLGKCPRENGDEHLPLVKRARVRMSKLSAAEAICAYPELEEQSPSQTLLNPPPLSCSSADNDINTSHLGTEAIPQDVASLETSLQYPDVALQVPKDGKNPPVGSSGSADVEAALPPSKRLHRALEAMSANATEPRPSSDEASLVVQMATSDCNISPVQSSSSLQMALDGKDTKAFEKQIFDSVGGGSAVKISGGSTSLDVKNSPETADAAIRDDDLREVGMQSECEMREKHVGNGTEVGNVLEISSAACMIVRPEEVPSPEPLSMENNESSLRKDEALLYEVSHGRELNGGPDFELLNHDTDGIEKLSGTPKCSEAGVDTVLKDENIDAELLMGQMEKYDSSTEMMNCNEIEHSRSHEDGCSRDLCKSSHDVPNQLAHENGIHTFSNGHLSEREESAAPFGSASLSDRVHSSHRVSPPTASACHLSTSASSRNSQSSGSASPAASSRFKRPEFEPSTVQPRSQDKLSNSDEVHGTLSSFEAVLGGLTRTKESIGRATRIALDCAKSGIAAKVVDSLARTLEREPSLYKRVDLFFLIDSIMQSSRGLKGAGGMYISIVQSKLPRLVTAAAPPGHTAHENRRQCLKVLRLWLERRILPEPMLRQHIRELDVMNGSSSAGPYSRRSARTERAFDDPIREMEGMLVDEYGSNSSFQLPGFCMPRMRKDDDEGAPVEKRGHILQDVDGELEMEDVAPIETEINDASTVYSAPGSLSVGQQFQPPFAPAPPQDIPPSSAPLPLSTLPPPPPLPFSSGLPSHLPNGVDQNAHRSSNDVPSNMAQHGVHHMAPRDDHRIHEPPPYHSPDFRDREKQMQVHHNDGSYGRRPMNNFRENDGPWDHRGFPLRPPHHGDQLSYDQRFRSRRDPPPPSHSRYHSPHNRGNGGNHYNHQPERLKPPPHDMRENWRFSGPYSEPRYHEKARNFHPGPPQTTEITCHSDLLMKDPISGDRDEPTASKLPLIDMMQAGLNLRSRSRTAGQPCPSQSLGNYLPLNIRVLKQSCNNR